MSEKPILYIYHTDRIPLEILCRDGILLTVKKVSKEKIVKMLSLAKKYFEVIEKQSLKLEGILIKDAIVIYRDRIYDDYYGFYEDIYYILYRVKVVEVNGFCCLTIPESEHLQALLAEAGII